MVDVRGLIDDAIGYIARPTQSGRDSTRSPNISIHIGDRVGGDKVENDKVQGDKSENL
jgi:hypothetical protein